MNILDLFFPKKCVSCHKPGQYFCPLCIAKIQKVALVCPVCEQPSPFGQTHFFCQTKLSLDGLISLFAYRGTMRSAIHKLKYRLVTDLTKDLWSLVLKELKEKEESLKCLNAFIKSSRPLVVPIPLYWYKENKRGFNQATLLGQKIASYYGLSFSEEILFRQRFTPTQTTLSPKQRQKNVQNAFSVSPKIQNTCPNILLVDDIWTTGSTLKTATVTLKKAGAKKIWGLTLAR